MKYKIEITETLQKVVEVEAETLTEAITKVGTDYANSEIVLDEMDFVGYNITEFLEGENERRT